MKKKVRKFEVGDVVQFKSGGPKMTISQVNEDTNNHLCVWFDNEGRSYQSYFSKYILKVVK